MDAPPVNQAREEALQAAAAALELGAGPDPGSPPRGAPLETETPAPVPAEPGEDGDLWYCPDGSFVKKITARGRGLDKPKLGSRCRVRALGFPFGSGLPEGRTEVTLGLGSWREVTWGEVIEKCLESMREGEEAEIRVPGQTGAPFGLKLDAFTPGRDSWELSAPEKEALAREEQARGTELFRAGNPEGAARCYGRALRLLQTLPPPGPAARAALHANLAACQLRLGRPRLAAQSCDRALEREPGHLKALYRRGVAQAALGNLDRASADLQRVLAADPKNRAAREELGKVIDRGQRQDARLAQGLRKMFG